MTQNFGPFKLAVAALVIATGALVSCSFGDSFDPDIKYMEVPEGFSSPLDQIYVINLDKSKARLELMQREFDRVDMSFERFPAVNGYDYNLQALKDNGTYQRDRNIQRHELTLGEIGNSFSHYNIIRDFVNSDLEMIMVLEDDVRFIEGFETRLLSLLAHAPDNWDMIFLGCNASEIWLNGFYPLEVAEDRRFFELTGSSCIAGNYAFIINKDGARKLLPHKFPFKGPSDTQITKEVFSGKNGTFNAYCARPELVKVNFDIESEIKNMGRNH